MSMQNVLERLKEGAVVVIAADRTDVLLAVLLFFSFSENEGGVSVLGPIHGLIVLVLLYTATNKVSWMVIGLTFFLAGGFVAYQLVYPGTVGGWADFWTAVAGLIGFTAPADVVDRLEEAACA